MVKLLSRIFRLLTTKSEHQLRQMQVTQNRLVLKQLEKRGDDLTKEREVFHWITFNTQEAIDQFELFAMNLGFQTLNKEKTTQSEEHLFTIKISRIDQVGYDAIDQCVLTLWQKAFDLSGSYDGWETSVEK